jgi:hypothetical protein
MGFTTGPVASDGPLGDSVVVRNAGKWVLGAARAVTPRATGLQILPL